MPLYWFAKAFDPVKVGNIDGSLKYPPHDKALTRALKANYKPKPQSSDPLKTLFVGNLPFDSTENDLQRLFDRYGAIKSVKLVKNAVSDKPRGYGFVEFERTRDCDYAYEKAFRMRFRDRELIVDYERSRVMKNWVPRRLGGGFGGKKESGQLRFGCRERPFREPRSFHLIIRVLGNRSMFKVESSLLKDDCWRRKED